MEKTTGAQWTPAIPYYEDDTRIIRLDGVMAVRKHSTGRVDYWLRGIPTEMVFGPFTDGEPFLKRWREYLEAGV